MVPAGIVAAVVVIVVLVLTRLCQRRKPGRRSWRWLAIIAAISYFVVILSSKHINGTERRRVLAFIPMFIASAGVLRPVPAAVHRGDAVLGQRLNRLLGWEMPIAWVQSINPVFIILLPRFSPRYGPGSARSSPSRR